jgi:hypothetical protein
MCLFCCIFVDAVCRYEGYSPVKSYVSAAASADAAVVSADEEEPDWGDGPDSPLQAAQSASCSRVEAERAPLDVPSGHPPFFFAFHTASISDYQISLRSFVPMKLPSTPRMLPPIMTVVLRIFALSPPSAFCNILMLLYSCHPPAQSAPVMVSVVARSPLPPPAAHRQQPPIVVTATRQRIAATHAPHPPTHPPSRVSVIKMKVFVELCEASSFQPLPPASSMLLLQTILEAMPYGHSCIHVGYATAINLLISIIESPGLA